MKSATAPPSLPMINEPQSARSLRVGFVSPNIAVGGAERWILSLAKSFRSCIAAGVCGYYGEKDPDIADAFRREVPTLYGKESIPKLWHNSDVLVVWGLRDIPEIPWPRDKPIINVLHSTSDLHHSKEIASDSLRWCNFVAGVAEECTNSMPESARHIVATIPNGSELQRLEPRLGRDVMRRNWSATGVFELRPDDIVLLYLGRISKEKQTHKCVMALSNLPSNYKLLIVGKDHSQKLMPIVREVADQFPGRVGFCSHMEDIGDLHAMSDVLVAPSIAEAHSLSINEAWLSGLPVVTCNYPTARAMEKRHGPMSYLADVSVTAGELARIIELAAKNGRNSEIPRRAMAIAWTHYTAKAMASRWESYLHLCHYTFNRALETPSLEHVVRQRIANKQYRQTGQA